MAKKKDNDRITTVGGQTLATGGNVLVTPSGEQVGSAQLIEKRGGITDEEKEQPKSESATEFFKKREKLINELGLEGKNAPAIATKILGERGLLAPQVTRSVAEVQAEIQRREQAAGRIGAVSEDISELSPLLTPELLPAGGVGAATGLLTKGALTGTVTGTAGAVATPVAIGFGLGAIAQLRSEAKQQVEAQRLSVFDRNGAINNMKAIINELNAGRLDPVEAVILYNNEIAKINRAERQLQLMTDSQLRKFLGSPGDELIKVQNFNSFGRGVLDRKLEEALLVPNPNLTLNYDLEGIQQ